MNVIADLLLGLSIAFSAMAAIGIALAPDFFARIHYLSLVSLFPPVLVAMAALFAKSGVGNTLKIALISLILVGSGPLMVHLLARAGCLRERRETSR